MFIQPTLISFTTNYPSYADPDYTNLQEILDEAYVLYGDLIARLPPTKQSIAFKYIVCHLFQLSCWEACGYAGTPNTIKSRNEQITFNGNLSGLKGTTCGMKFLALVQGTLGGYYYVGSEPVCHRNSCGC